MLRTEKMRRIQWSTSNITRMQQSPIMESSAEDNGIASGVVTSGQSEGLSVVILQLI